LSLIPEVAAFVTITVIVTLIISIIVDLFAKVKGYKNKFPKGIHSLLISSQIMLGAFLGLWLGIIIGMDLLIFIGGTAEGPMFIAAIIGGPVGAFVGGVIGLMAGIICIKISTALVNWASIDTA
jgi:hypothetical protein